MELTDSSVSEGTPGGRRERRRPSEGGCEKLWMRWWFEPIDTNEEQPGQLQLIRESSLVDTASPPAVRTSVLLHVPACERVVRSNEACTATASCTEPPLVKALHHNSSWPRNKTLATPPPARLLADASGSVVALLPCCRLSCSARNACPAPPYLVRVEHAFTLVFRAHAENALIVVALVVGVHRNSSRHPCMFSLQKSSSTGNGQPPPTAHRFCSFELTPRPGTDRADDASLSESPS